jgi:apolipoprotein D and lipocalin family protein
MTTSQRTFLTSLLRAIPLVFVSLYASLMVTGCQSSTSLPPIRTEAQVDLERFMGDWYVIAAIPTFIEKESYNAVETYELLPDNRIATTFSFNKGGFDGPLKSYNPVGFVRDDPSSAIWGMQFIWPIKAEYRVVYVDAAYTTTIIGRTKRDYVWIMARTPFLPEDDYLALLEIVSNEGYDLTKLRKVPHQRSANP